VSPNGVLGDPTGATAEEGEAIFALLADDLEETVQSWRTAPDMNSRSDIHTHRS
jgi:creatinine amidohydrolase